MWYPTKYIVSLIISVMVAIFPCLSYLNQPFAAEDEQTVQLNMTLISDVHIDYRELLGQSLLRQGMRGLNKSESTIDGLVVAGDVTNYGDERSVGVFYDIVTGHAPDMKLVIAPGNHDIGHVKDITQQQARENLVSYYNEYTGSEIENIYYSTEINGYRFIVLGDDGDDTWDQPEISAEQLAFLDSELAEATADGKAAFVVCHQPINNTNGQQTVWDDGGLGDDSDAVQAVLEKYENVFFISGHLHAGINSDCVHRTYGVYSVETINGVNYVNLPTYALVNRFGIPWSCTGMQMEVYEDEVIFRARDYVSERWYPNYNYRVALV